MRQASAWRMRGRRLRFSHVPQSVAVSAPESHQFSGQNAGRRRVNEAWDFPETPRGKDEVRPGVAPGRAVLQTAGSTLHHAHHCDNTGTGGAAPHAASAARSVFETVPARWSGSVPNPSAIQRSARGGICTRTGGALDAVPLLLGYPGMKQRIQKQALETGLVRPRGASRPRPESNRQLAHFKCGASASWATRASENESR